MSNNIIFLTDNIAIMQADNTMCVEIPTISPQDLPQFYETVSLPVAKYEPATEGLKTDIKSFFGVWIESGDEDAQIDELYKSRLHTSQQF